MCGWASFVQFFGKSVMLVRKGPLDRPSGPDDRRDNPTLNYQGELPCIMCLYRLYVR